MKYFIIFLLLFQPLIFAKEKQFELGLGVASLYYPDYIGSKSTQFLTLPFPYIRYIGKYLKIDEDGISSEFFGVNGLKLSLSIAGSLPASSKKNSVREGMPDLDLAGEIGLKLSFEIFKKNVSSLTIELPLRTLITTDFTHLFYRGLIANPELKYALKYTKYFFSFRSGLLYTNKKYNNYYYGVKEVYETSLRKSYSSRSGFAGLRSKININYKMQNWRAGGFFSYFNINNAVFKNSPLIKTHHALYSGVSIAYVY